MRAERRADGAPAMMAASMFGNVLPGMWSFMLAARARGLGTAAVQTMSIARSSKIASRGRAGTCGWACATWATSPGSVLCGQ